LTYHFTAGQYNLVSMALNTLGVQLDEGIAKARGIPKEELICQRDAQVPLGGALEAHWEERWGRPGTLLTPRSFSPLTKRSSSRE